MSTETTTWLGAASHRGNDHHINQKVAIFLVVAHLPIVDEGSTRQIWFQVAKPFFRAVASFRSGIGASVDSPATAQNGAS
jgi:hypothetical protein